MGSFLVRQPGAEARRILSTRRVEAINAEVERVRARSSWWRRLLCRLRGSHHLWRTGLAGVTPSGSAVALLVCTRCGSRHAEVVGQELAP